METLIGKTIDNYRILEVIGRGGMGVVFKALDTSLEKIVAIKMIDPFLARDENFVRRFKTEAKALAKLENSNIVGVYALRETAAGFFMVMEYVESKPLSHSLQENGPFNLKDILSITKQLLNAIGHAHKVGVIHRDIKPSNILLCSNGRIKVNDFGLAKVVEQKGPASTVTQARAGTLYYMSPEQVKGLKNVDTRSDLYSLGMTVYEMTAGRTPFEKTDTDFTIQRKIVDGEIPSVVKFNPDIPKKFAKIITKCTDKEPDKRYQTADEMLEDLLNFEKELLDKENKVEKPLRVKHVNKKLLIGIVTVASVLLILSSILFFFHFGKSAEASFLSVSSSPTEAEVLIDTSKIGITPIENYQLEKEGRIKIRIVKEDFMPWDTSINVTAGKKDSLNIMLTKIPIKQITINTKPAGAELYLNNKSIGLSNLNKFSMKVGEYRLKIEKNGYGIIDTSVNINENITKPFEFILNKELEVGTLIVSSIPTNAEVWLDGKKMGTTTYENKQLPVKGYELLIRKDDYKEYRSRINITKNPKTVNQPLTAIGEPTEGFGVLKITSKPRGTAIYLDDELYGSTPKDIKLKPGDYKLKLEMTGYEEINERIEVKLNKPTPFDKDLYEKNIATPKIKIEILVRPYGDIYIDGQIKMSNTTSKFIDSVTIGKHNIRVTHPTKGKYDKQVNVDENGESHIFNFERKLLLRITSEPTLAEILLDGAPTGNYTTFELPLSPGTHKISVRKAGYIFDDISYPVPSAIFEAKEDQRDKLHFKQK